MTHFYVNPRLPVNPLSPTTIIHDTEVYTASTPSRRKQRPHLDVQHFRPVRVPLISGRVRCRVAVGVVDHLHRRVAAKLGKVR